jgi:glycosyltransferase involved in cell wall biosynthesis
MEGFNAPLMTLSRTVENDGFWDGLSFTQASSDWLQQAAVVVQPAFIENAPRALLRALAAGIPVIATAECGIAERPGLTLIASGDVIALRSAITQALAGVEVSAMHSA